jgi:hypothetical protein
LTRATFRGHSNVDAPIVNTALVSQLNTMSDARFPFDGGLNAGRRIGAVDFVIEAGDITNREEHTDELSIQPASASWSQFVADYINGVHLRDHSGAAAQVFVVPGNHEASNAVGFYKTMIPPTDAFPLIETSPAVILAASDLATHHRFGIWDAVVFAAAAAAGCRLLLSEDLQPGFTWNGVTVANPFSQEKHELLAGLLRP